MDVMEVDAATLEARLDEFARILEDAVASGASVSFMAPFPLDAARAYWRSLLPRIAARGVVLLAATEGGRPALGTVQLHVATPPNQPHRADIAKLLVHRSARRRGLGRLLMLAAEEVAARHGRTLLTLDTASPDAERLYDALGYERAGVIPGYALLPDGAPCHTTIFYKRLGATAQ
jgi:ribosomal protein S18 acetylase RimI-like enzyme